MATITVMNPQGERPAAKLAVPPLPADLRGLTIGFLDNTKHNFDLLVHEMGALLKERLGVKAVVYRRKANAATAAADEIVEGSPRTAISSSRAPRTEAPARRGVSTTLWKWPSAGRRRD
jgi:hypothetical protein